MSNKTYLCCLNAYDHSKCSQALWMQIQWRVNLDFGQKWQYPEDICLMCKVQIGYCVIHSSLMCHSAGRPETAHHSNWKKCLEWSVCFKKCLKRDKLLDIRKYMLQTNFVTAPNSMTVRGVFWFYICNTSETTGCNAGSDCLCTRLKKFLQLCAKTLLLNLVIRFFHSPQIVPLSLVFIFSAHRIILRLLEPQSLKSTCIFLTRQ